MINAVSSVSFGDNKDFSALVNSPGKYSSNAAAVNVAAQAGDRVELSGASEKEKNNTGKIIGGIVGALALAWIGLGIAVGHKGSKWTKIEAPEGIAQKAKNFFYTIGESAKKAYDSTLGKLFGQSADNAAKAGEEAAK